MVEEEAHACHELKDTGLCLIEEHGNLVQTGQHFVVFADSSRHSAS